MARLRLFIPQPIPESAVERLRRLVDVEMFPHLDRRISREELLKAVKDKEILFALGEVPYDAEVIEAARNLKLIAAMHGSATFVDVAAATRRHVPVTYISGEFGATTAELTFAHIMAAAWRLGEADRFVREGRWKQNQSMAFLVQGLEGKTLSLFGFGAIARKVAQFAQVFGMRVLYHKRTRLSPEEEERLGVQWREFDDLFREGDYVVLAAKLTLQTKGIVNERVLRLMKPTAYLINTARGLMVDEEALVKALKEGWIAGAGLDVFRYEPPASDPAPHPELLKMPNVILTPHIGTATWSRREKMAHAAVDSIEAFLRGERPPFLLNPETYGEPPRPPDDRIG